MVPIEIHYSLECPFTFEEAFEKFKEYAELYGHLAPVSLYYDKGGFTLTHTEYEQKD